jgi:hypothetical protein
MEDHRDPTKFPDDADGDALWRMYVDGDDLSAAREIDFWSVFTEERNAIDFAVEGLRKGWKISFSEVEGEWQVGVHLIMVPNYESITGFQDELSSAVMLFNGVIDGWGCFEA